MRLDLYGGEGTVEVDYRGYDVTVENLIRLLTGRHEEHVPRSKRLLSDDSSNVLIYLTGHGGDEFLKFQDHEEIGAWDLADAVQQMYEKRRYRELLFMVDTCQASTLYKHFYSPNVIASGSSQKDESSYSHHHSHDIGLAVIDRYTYWVLEFMERHVESMQSQATVKQLFDSLQYDNLLSHHGVRTDLFQRRSYDNVLITDFFGNVPQVVVTEHTYPLPQENATRNPLKQYVVEDVDIDGIDISAPGHAENDSLTHWLYRLRRWLLSFQDYFKIDRDRRDISLPLEPTRNDETAIVKLAVIILSVMAVCKFAP